MKNFQDRVVVITGAGSGIGRGLALAFAARGARLALCDKDRRGLSETCKLLQEKPSDIFAQELDVSDRQAFLSFAQEVKSRLGTASVVINNAGVALSEDFTEMQRSDFEWLFAINFWGVVNGCEAFLPQLREQREASLVNISSCFGLVAMPTQSAYCASKFAVRGFTESLRAELRKTGVRPLVVHPGGVKTNIVRGGRHYQGIDGLDREQLAARFDKIALSSPEGVAQKIIRAIEKRDSRLVVGADAKIFDWVARISPRLSNLIASMIPVQKPLRPVSSSQAVSHKAS